MQLNNQSSFEREIESSIKDTAISELERLLQKIISIDSSDQDIPSTDNSLVLDGDWATLKVAAEVATKTGNCAKAEIAWLRALEVAHQFGDNDPRIADTLTNIALFYLANGKFKKSEEFYKRALAVCEDLYGAKDEKTAKCLSNLAGLYYRTQRFAEAEILSVRTLTIYNKVLGAEHIMVAIEANNLASVYQAQNKLDLAELMYERALPIYKRAFGKTHNKYKAIVEGYADLLSVTNRHWIAEAIRAELVKLEKLKSHNEDKKEVTEPKPKKTDEDPAEITLELKREVLKNLERRLSARSKFECEVSLAS